jgi:NADH:ubiquinone oxidoreductase subunit 2 (subunit N)
MLSAVIAAFLYLRIVVSMYMTESEAEMEEAEVDPVVARRLAAGRVRVPFAAGLALAVAFVATIGWGFFPTGLADSSRDAVATVSAPAK